mmetsp:Transcript_5257/g.11556  ORF Transcript_5257/g.11556 Transcript_5257/m.11556 type:complete len:360 (-) Transcript_5257:321-1400(-)
MGDGLQTTSPLRQGHMNIGAQTSNPEHRSHHHHGSSPSSPQLAIADHRCLRVHMFSKRRGDPLKILLLRSLLVGDRAPHEGQPDPALLHCAGESLVNIRDPPDSPPSQIHVFPVAKTFAPRRNLRVVRDRLPVNQQPAVVMGRLLEDLTLQYVLLAHSILLLHAAPVQILEWICSRLQDERPLVDVNDRFLPAVDPQDVPHVRVILSHQIKDALNTGYGRLPDPIDRETLHLAEIGGAVHHQGQLHITTGREMITLQNGLLLEHGSGASTANGCDLHRISRANMGDRGHHSGGHWLHRALLRNLRHPAHEALKLLIGSIHIVVNNHHVPEPRNIQPAKLAPGAFQPFLNRFLLLSSTSA